MNLARDYAGAHFRDSWVVLGVRLRAFTLGHALLLQRLGSPFAPYDADAAEQPAGLGDVLLALFVLSRPAKQAADAIGGKWFRLLSWYWATRFRLEVALCPAKIMAVPEASMKLCAYIREACKGPRMWDETTNDGRRRGAPALGVIKVNLQRLLGYTNRDALDIPIQQAIWDCSICWEMNGTARIDTNDLDALTRQVRADLAAANAN